MSEQLTKALKSLVDKFLSSLLRTLSLFHLEVSDLPEGYQTLVKHMENLAKSE